MKQPSNLGAARPAILSFHVVSIRGARVQVTRFRTRFGEIEWFLHDVTRPNGPASDLFQGSRAACAAKLRELELELAAPMTVLRDGRVVRMAVPR